MSYGTFQTYYTVDKWLHGSNTSASTLAWIGSIQNSLLLFENALSGKYFDGGWYREMTYSGTFLVVFGLMMISLVTQYWQALLAQGICVGLGLDWYRFPHSLYLARSSRRKEA